MGAKRKVNIKALSWNVLLAAMQRTAAEPGFNKTGLTCAEIVEMMKEFENLTKGACRDAGADFYEGTECQACRG